VKDLLREYRVMLTQQAESSWGGLCACTLLSTAELMAARAKLDVGLLDAPQLRGLAHSCGLTPELGREISAFVARCSVERLSLAHQLGALLDRLQASEVEVLVRARALAVAKSRRKSSGPGLVERVDVRRNSERQRTGSYFTPELVARAVVARALPQVASLAKEREALSVCDPAAGGGAFLLEAARVLCALQVERGLTREAARIRVGSQVYGVDQSELATAVLGVVLWLYLSEGQAVSWFSAGIATGDALTGRGVAGSMWSKSLPGRTEAVHFSDQFPRIVHGFDWIVGNPPWVAFQGRAAHPLDPKLRAFYREAYQSFRGYPTLQAMFAERAAALAPHGVVSLLLPSSLSDLDGYAPARQKFTQTHSPVLPLEEYAQDTFSGVVQACFALVGEPIDRGGGTLEEQVDGHREGTPERWPLAELDSGGAERTTVVLPRALHGLADLPRMPREVFGELGFQTNRRISLDQLWRGSCKTGRFTVALLEGKKVREFLQESPGVFLDPNPVVLRETRSKLRDREAYERVDFVIRQTAQYPIAAVHGGERFRNSLLAGYAVGELDTHLLVGLLNSALYRGWHLAAQRDARQKTFPQVKLTHLRNLPAPPACPELRERVRQLSADATANGGLSDDTRERLDAAVFDLFGCTNADRAELLAFLEVRASSALRCRP